MCIFIFKVNKAGMLGPDILLYILMARYKVATHQVGNADICLFLQNIKINSTKSVQKTCLIDHVDYIDKN